MADAVFTPMSKDERTEIALRWSSKARDSRTHLLSKENAETTVRFMKAIIQPTLGMRRGGHCDRVRPAPHGPDPASTNDPHAKFRKKVE
jgi:hypothetical protein